MGVLKTPGAPAEHPSFHFTYCLQNIPLKQKKILLNLIYDDSSCSRLALISFCLFQRLQVAVLQLQADRAGAEVPSSLPTNSSPEGRLV